MRPIFAVPAIAALVYRAWSKNSLTPAGIVVATLTAIAHAYHPWNLPFVLLCVFFLAGTRATHIKEDVKQRLTIHSKGSSGGEGPRTHVQVLANSLMASILTVLHARQLYARKAAYIDPAVPDPEGKLCYAWGGDVLIVGIIANYAAVAADTFSSELGILSKSQPRLITSLTLRKVPPGTNGGVTLMGLGAGLLGSVIIVTAAMVFMPACAERTADLVGGGSPWTVLERRKFMGFLVLWGTLGSLVDSFLGGLLQRSVKDVRTGKIVEGEGGHRVLVSESPEQVPARSTAGAAIRPAARKQAGKQASSGSAVADDDDEDADVYNPKNKHRKPSFGDAQPSRVVESGWDLLDNNDVNFIMAVTMSVSAMAVASWYWGVPVENILSV